MAEWRTEFDSNCEIDLSSWDAAIADHFRMWLSGYIRGSLRREIARHIVEQIENDPELLARPDLSWPTLRDRAV